ncbi:MAG: sigma-70 family RNA polymerase sigma factor [Planctomycetota bacterium]|jgi:RNA polymerase sigma factor (TIGR02999 family)
MFSQDARHQESRGDVTRLLGDISAGRQGASEELMSHVYAELRSLAAWHLRGERTGHTLQATALVHEAWLRLALHDDVPWESRAHFLRVASRAMRRILIEHARRKQADKRGGGRRRVPLEDVGVAAAEASLDLLALDEALTRLASIHERMSQVVELRYFGGLTVEETARVLDSSPMTVKRDWQAARAWLKAELSRGDGPQRSVCG